MISKKIENLYLKFNHDYQYINWKKKYCQLYDFNHQCVCTITSSDPPNLIECL